MGYTTDFDGEFAITPRLKPEHKAYLEAFKQRRHVHRDPSAVAHLPDPIRESAGLPVGPLGAYFVAYGADAPIALMDMPKTAGELARLATKPSWCGPGSANDEGPGVLDKNPKRAILPGIWCQWEPSDSGDALVWDGAEKFYAYQEWLVFLIEHFLKPWGYTVKGSVEWQGEDSDDTGTLFVANNLVFTGDPIPDACVECGGGSVTIKGSGQTGEKHTCDACGHTIVVYYSATGWDSLSDPAAGAS